MSRLRTFIAVELSKPIRDRLIALQQSFASVASGVKWVEPENLHVTLLFLGEVENREVPGVCQAVSDAVQGVAPIAIAVKGAGCFPNPRRPRVLWVGVGAGAQELIAMHDALEPPLLELGCYRREARRYTPHVTLGRVKGEHAPAGLALALAKHQTWTAGDMTVGEVHVMSSELTSSGPSYTVLSRASLGG